MGRPTTKEGLKAPEGTYPRYTWMGMGWLPRALRKRKGKKS